MDHSQCINLIHPTDISLGELKVLDVGEVFSELGKVRNQFVEGDEIKLCRRSFLSLQIQWCGSFSATFSVHNTMDQVYRKMPWASDVFFRDVLVLFVLQYIKYFLLESWLLRMALPQVGRNVFFGSSTTIPL